MRSSIVLASFCAALSVASPMLRKKEYVTDITTEIVYVTVTEGELPPSTSSKHSHHHSATTVNVVNTVVVTPTPAAPDTTTTLSSSSSSTPPPPPPSTTSTPPAPAPQPTSTTSTTPAPEPTTTSATEAAAVPTTAAAPVVVAEVAATTATAAASAASPTDYDGVAIWHHNQHRSNHTAGALVWDSTLATYALATANTCVFAHDMTEGGGGYGQNLAAYGSSDLSSVTTAEAVADAITNQWYYGEAANMPYGVASPAVTGVPEFLHFSAMLWKASTKVGCATVTCAAGTVFSDVASLYTVCDYESEGNILGEFDTQVTGPIGLAAITATI